MKARKSLKEQNAWLVRTALVLHALAFAYVVFQPFPLAQFAGPDSLHKVQQFLAPSSISLGVIALTRLVLLGLIPARIRDRLVHWRWAHPLPGARAFTKIGPADPRVDMKKLRKKYGQLPVEPGKQSRLFYMIYKTHAEDVGVLDAHKSYLAARDISIINLSLLIILPPLAAMALHDPKRTGTYALALFFVYVVTCVTAQIYGVRLVENSLAAASQT
jgi:hypothetical protein